MYRRQDSGSIAALLEPYARGDRTCCRTSRCINTLCDSAPKLERLKSCVRGLNSIYYAGNQLTAGSYLKTALDKATCYIGEKRVFRFDHKGWLAPDVGPFPIVCAKAWEVLHGISHTRRLALGSALAAPSSRKYTALSKDRKQTEHVRCYLGRLFDSGICEEMPTCDSEHGRAERHLPPFMNPLRVYVMYKEYCDTAEGNAGEFILLN